MPTCCSIMITHSQMHLLASPQHTVWHAQLQPDMVTNQHRLKLWWEISSSFQLLEMYINHCDSHYSCSLHHTHHHCNAHLENKNKIKNTAAPEESSFYHSYHSSLHQTRIQYLILLHGASFFNIASKNRINH